MGSRKVTDMLLRVAGESGEGILTTGELLTFAAARLGLNICNFRTYPAEVTGGQSLYQVRLTTEKFLSPWNSTDILIVFDEDAFNYNIKSLHGKGSLVYDPDLHTPLLEKNSSASLYGLPMTKISKEQVGLTRTKNMVALGAAASMISIPYGNIADLIQRRFKSMDRQTLDKNVEALKLGYDHAEQNSPARYEFPRVRVSPTKIYLTGNTAIALGALKAGCKFYAGYPITPSSSILEYLSREFPKFGGIMFQTEDELAALSAAIGASFGGVKSMTATSGPGFSLMAETLDLASMAEIPVVIVDVQRAGPSTGMPTKTEQGDLNAALYQGHGDAPRIVLAPADVEDCFHLTIKAFNLSERCQMPAIILSEQSLSDRAEMIEKPDLSKIKVEDRMKPNYQEIAKTGEYKRYKITENGVSPMSTPGDKYGIYVSESLEREENAKFSYEPEAHQIMMEKRFRKLRIAEDEPNMTRSFSIGKEKADLGVISFGPSEDAVIEAVTKANKEGKKVSSLHILMLSPLPIKQIKPYLERVNKVIVAELNHTGQLSSLLAKTLLLDSTPLRKTTGLPFTTEEIFNKIKEVAP
ncbi:MAG: 2-oxoacid:acceptor oxidoreductase subunit alpha [Candidatus Atabeyarchaeum deiterrae]